jgi:hypothetical protein
MAQRLDKLAELQEYARGVVTRAAHHAHNVENVLDYLLGQVILHHDPGSVECRTYKNKPTNILRFSVRQRAVALAYNHKGQVELREGNEHGHVLATFTNADSRQHIAQEFGKL